MTAIAEAPQYLSETTISRADFTSPPGQTAREAPGVLRIAWGGLQPSAMVVPAGMLSARWFQPTVASLLRTLQLGPGWDTYSARRITPRSAELAVSFLSRVLEAESSPPAVIPLADGGIQLEWHRGGLDIEVVLSPDDEPEMYVADLESGEDWELSADAPDAVHLLRALRHRLRTS